MEWNIEIGRPCGITGIICGKRCHVEYVRDSPQRYLEFWSEAMPSEME